MDRAIPENVQNKRLLHILYRVVIVVSILTIGFFGFRYVLKPKVEASRVKFSKVDKGTVLESFAASGVVVPAYEEIITSPIQTRIEKALYNIGDQIQPGASLIRLNKEEVSSEYERTKDEYQMKLNKISQVKLKLAKNLKELETQWGIKKLMVESLTTKLANARHLVEIGGSNEQSVKQAALDLKIAEMEFALIEKQKANLIELTDADLRELYFEISIQKKELDELQRKIELSDVKATKAGIITSISTNIGSTVSEGDELVRIADLTSYKVECSIAELHADKLRRGGEVQIKVNETELRGRIINVNPSSENGIIKFYVLFDRLNDQVRNNQKVEVHVINSRKDGVLRVTNGPFFSGSKQQNIFVVEGDDAVKRSVHTGISSFDYVEIVDNINEGEEIIISDLQEYMHLDRVKIDR